MLREEHRLRVFGKRVLKRIFGPQREKLAGDWIRLHNEYLYNLQASPNISGENKQRRMRWTGHIARIER
jgi:hypothetical protein